MEEQLTARDNFGATVQAGRACHDFCAGVWVGQSTYVASQSICYTKIENAITHELRHSKCIFYTITHFHIQTKKQKTNGLSNMNINFPKSNWKMKLYTTERILCKFLNKG